MEAHDLERGTPSGDAPATKDLDKSVWTRSKGTKARVALWAVFAVVAAGLVVAIQLRPREVTSFDTAGFKLEFPDGYSKAKSSTRASAISNGDATVVLLDRLLARKVELTVPKAKARLESLSCGGKPRAITSNGQRAVVADAPEPCTPFDSTAIVFGPKYSTSVSCSAPKRPAAVTACRQTLEGLHVK